MDTKIEKEIHDVFDVTLFLKAIHAGIEVAGGLLLYFMNRASIVGLVDFFIREEISEEPHNVLLNYISQTAQYFSNSSKTIAAFYLLSHGLVNAFIVISLYKEKLWAYPLSIAVLGFFSIYQVYNFIHSHSIMMIALTILDFIIIGLVWHEYGIVKNKKG